MQAIILMAIQAMPLVEKLTSWIQSTMARAKKAGELTPEQEAAWQAHKKAVLSSAAAQVEPDPTD